MMFGFELVGKGVCFLDTFLFVIKFRKKKKGLIKV
jgi:hypothetical protein